MWSEDYDRELKDVFAVQDEIAQAIVSEFRVKLVRTGGATPQTTRPTGNAEAYDLYLKGRYFLNSQGTQANPRALFFSSAHWLSIRRSRAHTPE